MTGTILSGCTGDRVGEIETQPTRDACPICGSSTPQIVRRFSGREVAQHFVRREVDSDRHDRLLAHVNELWGRGECAIVSCQKCGFGFAVPYIAGDALFYELASGNSNYPKWKWEFQRTLDTLRNGRIALSRTGPLLEIGAGNGALLQALSQAGWPKESLTGLEYSTFGLQSMRAQDLACHAMDVRELEADEPFEVICMFQVLEHMDGLSGLFDKLGRLSGPGTDLFIAVPNGEWQRANAALGFADDYPPNHIGLWRPEHFEAIASRYDWTIVTIELEPSNRVKAARYAFAERFLRNSEVSHSLANTLVRVASLTQGRVSSRMVKVLGAALQLDCWRLAFERLVFASPSPNIWCHLRRTE